jgi:xanthine dehydrogenase YagS FAD-binding subunit
VQVTGPAGDRAIAFADYHRLPGDEPWRDNALKPGELVTAIDLPSEDFSANYTYLKLRDRLSYAFALVSVAVAMTLENGRIAEVRIALGGVAHKPWRREEAEEAIRNEQPSATVFDTAARALLAGAVGQGENDFKFGLAHKVIVRALAQAAAGTPQSQTDKRVA